MVNEQDHNTQNSTSRRDLPGRLFRPHWSLFRTRRSPKPAPRPATMVTTDNDGPSVTPLPRDVICGGMYRACSTWQYEVVSHLITDYQGGHRLGYLTGQQYAALIHSDASSRHEAPLPTTQWRVVKVHEGDPSFARALADNRAVAVYAHRDVREVVFSLMHKRGMTFERLLRQGMIHQILANDRFWMAQPDVLIQRYDDLVADPARGVLELARHLDIRLDASDADQIAREYSHESNRARTESLRRRLQEAGVDLANAANAQICDPTTLLHWNHLRQGNSTTWSTLANHRHRVILDRLCRRWLRARGYSPITIDANSAKISLRERLTIEIDLIVGRATFLVRSASQRWPRIARSIKRILAMPIDSHAGATAWADPVPSRPNAPVLNQPHITITNTPAAGEPKLAGRDMRTS